MLARKARSLGILKEGQCKVLHLGRLLALLGNIKLVTKDEKLTSTAYLDVYVAIV